MPMRLVLVAALAAALALAPWTVGAQDLPEEPGAARTVKMFDLFCFALLPDLATIADIAGQHFEEITGDELARYKPNAGADDIRAWRFTDFEADYVLTTARTPADDAFRREFPELADATSFACSLVLPAVHGQDDIRAELARLMQREPDRSWESPPLRASLWVGQTENMVVNVLHYAPADGGAGGLLSAVAFVSP